MSFNKTTIMKKALIISAATILKAVIISAIILFILSIYSCQPCGKIQGYKAGTSHL